MAAALPLSHSQAAQIVRDEWNRIWGRDPSKLEVLFMLCVAWIESHYGRYPGQHADWAARGLYNWGNMEQGRNADGTCPNGWEPGSDAGSKRCFRVFNSDNEAAASVINNLTKRHWPVIQAIQSEGTAESVAHAMKFSPAYYEAPESQYATGLKNAANVIGQGLASEQGKDYIQVVKQESNLGTGLLFTGLLFAGVTYGTYQVMSTGHKVYKTVKL